MLIEFRFWCRLVVLVCMASHVHGNTDSLRQIWTDATIEDSVRFNAIHEYYDINLFSLPDSVIHLADYHIDLALQKSSELERAFALNKRGIAYNMKGNYEQALMEMNRTAEIYASMKDSLNLIGTYNNIALIYYYQVDYKQSLKFFEKCLRYYQEKKLSYRQHAALMNIGQVHLAINNNDKALEFFRKSLELGNEKDIDDDLSFGILWQNIATANFAKKMHRQAIENNQTALSIFERSRDRYYIANSHTLNARIYQELNQVDSALYYINKALMLHQSVGTDVFILKDKVILANLLLSTDLNKATELGEEVLVSANDYRDHAMKIDLYELLHKCYKSRNEHELSLTMLEKYRMYSDSLRQDQDQISVIKGAIQTEYETEIFNTHLLNEQEQSSLKLSQLKKTYIYSFIGLLIALSIVFYLRALAINQRKQKEELLNKIDHFNQLESTRHQLIQTERMASLGQLTAGVAHEINNPVNFISSGIIGLKKTLEMYTGDSKLQKTDELEKDMNDMITAIEEGARRTSDIVKSLRLFSRENSEQYMEADIISGLEVTFRLLSFKLKEDVFLEKEYEKNSLSIYCFPGQLYQVFTNILLNAIHATQDGGLIKVGVQEQGNDVLISISDSGPGIPDDAKQKIFEPFYTTKEDQEGSGLGLSISQGIMEKHQGSIEVRDNEPKGSIFIIRLPKRVSSLIA